MLACTALVGCTNEDVIDNPNENPVLNGEKAYLAINIVNANGTASRGTRANGDATNPFYYGTTEENEIASVDFYFYNSDFKYNQKVRKVLSWTANGENEPTTENIEKVGKATVVLENLTAKGTPKYVVTVLNAPTDWDTNLIDAESTLEEMAYAQNEALYNGSNNFIITSSNHKGADCVESTFGIATIIKDNNFLKQEPKEDLTTSNAVSIYVERVAAKVNLAAAEGTEFEGNSFTLANYEVDGETASLNVKIHGWALNGTTKKSFMLKNVNNIKTGVNWDDVLTTDIDESFDWDANVTDNHRTYWAASPNYNLTAGASNTGTTAYYPISYAATLDPDAQTETSDIKNATLNYLSWNTIVSRDADGHGVDMGKSLYCRENTNTADILESKYQNEYIFNSAVTSAVIAAQVVATVEGKEVGVDLVRYDATLYTPKGFLAEISNKMAWNNYATWTTTDGEGNKSTHSVKFDADFLEIVDLHDGIATVAVKSDIYAVINAKIEAAKDDSDNALNGLEAVVKPTNDTAGTTITWKTEKDNKGTEVQYAEAATALNTLNVKADHYKDGMMYYNIPIKHLRAGDDIFTDAENAQGVSTATVSVAEGEYGIVRNHFYQITVNKIANLGSAVNQPDESIVVSTKNDNLFYVGAQIYVLSWKVVNQGVDL